MKNCPECGSQLLSKGQVEKKRTGERYNNYYCPKCERYVRFYQ